MKLKNKFSKSVLSLAFVGTIGLSGCAAQETSNTTAVSSSSVATTTASSTSTASSSSSASSTSTISYDTHYSEDDLSWDDSDVTTIDLSNPEATDGVTVEDGTITITAAGNYKFTGTLADGQIKVAGGDQDAVHIILDNASITNADGPAINVESADEVVIYTNSDTTNTVSDGSNYSATGEDDPNAAIYSKSDLTLAGEGTLNVTGNYQNGITSKDGLVIASGTYMVKAQNNGITGKDYVDILDGTLNVEATEGDGIKSTNADEDERGWVRLQKGTVTISAGDNGFQAEKELEVDGGKLTVTKSDEGIEGQYITITGGEVNLTSSDDGLNATAPSISDTTSTESTSTDSTSSTTTDSTQQSNQQQGQAPGGDMGGQPPAGDMGGQAPGNMGGGAGGGMDEVADAKITITGGTTTVTAEGDGFDSNGTASISGGTLTVNGPSQGGNGVFDVNGDFTVSGGTLLAGGTSDMFVAPTTEGQGYLKTTELATSEGDEVTVVDSSGATVASYKVTDKGTAVFFASAEGIVSGQSYTINVNGEEAATVTAE
ncbi:MAG: carbohydrate-binding domain-containing protein [Rothia sp. (in: high G+C Gram-positive bacteria)]|nr:carbohydrate-binding domain-containing protein [Rothia sp. (in: high G+C Gram-positive bacteria)]